MDQSSIQRKRGLALIANYNQEREIRAVLERFPRYFPKEDAVVLDDGSTDTSAAIAEELGFRVIRHGVNRGIGAAIRTGIDDAMSRGYDYVVIMSANGKIRPEDLPQVIGPVMRGEADYTTGSRFMRGGQSPGLTKFRRFMIPIFSAIAWPVLGRRFSDITCGFRAYSLDLFRNPKCNIHQEWLSRYELEYYIHYWACKLKLRIQEVPVTIPYAHLERGRKSKIRPFTGWWSMFRPFVVLPLGIKR